MTGGEETRGLMGHEHEREQAGGHVGCGGAACAQMRRQVGGGRGENR